MATGHKDFDMFMVVTGVTCAMIFACLGGIALERGSWRECPTCHAHFVTSAAKTVDAPRLAIVTTSTATPEKP